MSNVLLCRGYFQHCVFFSQLSSPIPSHSYQGRVSFDLFLFRKRVSGRVMRVSNFAIERNEFQPKLAGSWMLHCNLKYAHLACSLGGGGGGGGWTCKVCTKPSTWDYNENTQPPTWKSRLTQAHLRTGEGEEKALPKSEQGLPQ